MAMIKDHNSYYTEEYYKAQKFPLSHKTHIVNVLENLLIEYFSKDILEVGCGSGSLMRLLKDLKYNIQGIDISPASAKLSGAKIASATKIPFKRESFDCVISLSTIEHLYSNEAKQFLHESWRVLRPGGIIFLATANFSSPLRYLLGKNWYGYGDRSHVKFYGPTSFKKLLTDNNFVNVRTTFKITTIQLDWPTPDTTPILLRKQPEIIRRLINVVLVSTPLAYLRDSLWIVAEKSSNAKP